MTNLLSSVVSSILHPTTKIDQLIQRWRSLGPADWAESEYGWILPSGDPIALADWQRSVLDAWHANPGVSLLGISAPMLYLVYLLFPMLRYTLRIARLLRLRIIHPQLYSANG